MGNIQTITVLVIEYLFLFQFACQRTLGQDIEPQVSLQECECYTKSTQLCE